jgi:predicted metal-dependent hydrolase
MPWIFRRRRISKRRKPQSPKQYALYKEDARVLVHKKLLEWNAHYNLEYKRVAIRNSRSRWGSCSVNKNLNFNYKILFLPETLQDYLIVHELCHLQEFNHGQGFWDLVAETIPNYNERRTELRTIERTLSTQKDFSSPAVV